MNPEYECLDNVSVSFEHIKNNCQTIGDLIAINKSLGANI